MASYVAVGLFPLLGVDSRIDRRGPVNVRHLLFRINFLMHQPKVDSER